VPGRTSTATAWWVDHRTGAFAAAAALAAVVTLVFATVGDGVDVGAEGVPGLVLDHAHTAVWALLTVALAVAALTGRWQRASSAVATVALVVYVLFLASLLLVA
jgi:hypothetical protein